MHSPWATAARVMPAAESTGALARTEGRTVAIPVGFATYAGAQSRTTISQIPRTTTPPAILRRAGDAVSGGVACPEDDSPAASAIYRLGPHQAVKRSSSVLPSPI